MNHTQIAKRMFEENIRFFTPLQDQDGPAMVVLHRGLAALADAIAEIDSKLAELTQRLERVEASPPQAGPGSAPGKTMVYPTFSKGLDP